MAKKSSSASGSSSKGSSKSSASSRRGSGSSKKKASSAKKKTSPAKKRSSATKKSSASRRSSGTKKSSASRRASTGKKASGSGSSTSRGSGGWTPPGGWGPFLRTELLLVLGGVLAGLLLAGMLLYVDARRQVRAYLEAPPASTPTTVWSAPIRLEVGQPLTAALLERDLLGAGYEQSAAADAPGRFQHEGATFSVWTPELDLPGVTVHEQRARITLSDGHVAATEPDAVVLLPTRLATLGDLEARRTPVTLETLSPWMAPALLAIEDARFHDHVGVDPIGIARALWHNLRGRDIHGGSTLTQQLAKNLFLHRERTIRRKLKEVFFAAALESELDKDALLELYLSEVYLGHVDGVPLYGVEQAARAWFGRSAANLTVAQAASIAGTIASPNAWSPLRDPAKALERRNRVVDRMVYVRALTEAQGAEAKAEPLTTVASTPSLRWRAPWAVDAALDRATEALGERFTPGAGLALHTTIQPHLQRAAQSAVTASLDDLADRHEEAADAEAALVVVEASTGDVLALVGGRDWVASPFNRATRAHRQAGSTVKPLVALAALDADPSLSTATLLDDSPLERTLDGRVWRPGNHDGRFLGPVSLADVMALSRNIPAVLLSERLGRTGTRDALRRAGLEEATDLPSAALGAFPTTPLALAGAYTVFPGDGRRAAPHLLTSVTGPGGASIWSHELAGGRIASAEATALATRTLQRVLTDGTGRSAGLGGEVGGKTGTTDAGRDAWFAGFDGRWSLVSWVGLDRGDLGLGGSTAALPLWARFLRDAGGPTGRLPRPSGVVEVEVCVATGQPPCPVCSTTGPAWFREGHVPEADCSLARQVVREEVAEIREERREERQAAREARQAEREARREGRPDDGAP